MTADVENAVTVEIKTSTGLSFVANTNMGAVSYSFGEELPAGTVITVKAGTVEDTVEVPEPVIESLVYDEYINRLYGVVVNASKVTIVTTSGVNVTHDVVDGEINYYFPSTLPGGTVITAHASADTFMNVTVPSILTNSAFNRSTKTYTCDIDGPVESVLVSAPDFGQTVNVVDGKVSVVIPTIPETNFYITIYYEGKQVELEVPPKPLAVITNLVYDYKTNTVTGDATNADEVIVLSNENAEVAVPVVNNKFSYKLINLVQPVTLVTVKAGSVIASVATGQVQTKVNGVNYPEYDANITLAEGVDTVQLTYMLNNADYVPAAPPVVTVSGSGSEQVTVDETGLVTVTGLIAGETVTAEILLQVDGREANGVNLILTREAE